MTQHIKEMIKERVMVLPVTKDYVQSLIKHILKIKNVYSGDMRILIDRLDDSIIKQDPLPHRRHKNELWVILNNGVPVTLYRRKEGLPFRQHINRYHNLEVRLTK